LCDSSVYPLTTGSGRAARNSSVNGAARQKRGGQPAAVTLADHRGGRHEAGGGSLIAIRLSPLTATRYRDSLGATLEAGVQVLTLD